MMAPRLERFIAISAIAHILFGAISMISIKKPQVEPLGVYTVTLVSEEAGIVEEASPPAPPSEVDETFTAKEKTPSTKKAIDKSIEKEDESKKEKEIDTSYKEKRIEELRERLHKQEAIRNLQKKGANEVDIKKSPIGKDSGSYALRLGSAIRQFWYYPLGKKGLEALISITILRDGTIRINKIEKSSGSSVFDESALRAIKKLHSFEPPESETDIILRFSDEELG